MFLPSFVGWAASLACIGVFLNAYGIPVSFDTLMHVAGGNSLANVTSFTPGGVGVTQAWNVASLSGVASSTDATAYSVAQQLVGTAWNILFALILMIWAWGWGGGKAARLRLVCRGEAPPGRGAGEAAREEEGGQVGGRRPGHPVSVTYGEAPGWTPERPRFRAGQLLLGWLLGAVSLVVATTLVPGASDSTFGAALAVAAALAVLNAVLPPLVAALRLPFTALLGFFLVLFVDAGMLLLADRVSSGLSIDSFWSALAVAVAAAAVGVVLSVVFGTNDDDVYSLRVVQRIARRSGERVVTDRPGIVFLEIDGLALPVLQRAMRDGHAPTLARWLEDGTHRLAEWEPDLSSQTGASQAGILLGSNDDIVAFRWVEKERKALVVCSSPEDCAELERRHATGPGLLVRRRREPRQPLLGRRRPRDPHRQPDGGRTLGQPRLPRLPRQRLQRGADVRALRLGGDPGMGRRREAAAPGRPATRPPGRRLSVPARDDVRHRPRPDRVRRPHRHDEGEARCLRDLRELRRGRTSLRPRA